MSVGGGGFRSVIVGKGGKVGHRPDVVIMERVGLVAFSWHHTPLDFSMFWPYRAKHLSRWVHSVMYNHYLWATWWCVNELQDVNVYILVSFVVQLQKMLSH